MEDGRVLVAATQQASQSPFDTDKQDPDSFSSPTAAEIRHRERARHFDPAGCLAQIQQACSPASPPPPDRRRRLQQHRCIAPSLPSLRALSLSQCLSLAFSRHNPPSPSNPMLSAAARATAPTVGFDCDRIHSPRPMTCSHARACSSPRLSQSSLGLLQRT